MVYPILHRILLFNAASAPASVAVSVDATN